MRTEKSRAQLNRLCGPFNGLRISTCKIVRRRDAGEYKAVERIARAHPERPLEVDQGVFGPSIEDQGPTLSAVGRREVRIEIKRGLEMSE